MLAKLPFVFGKPVKTLTDFLNKHGASDCLVKIFGDQGRHSRFAVGSNSLPMNIAVEIDAIIKLN